MGQGWIGIGWIDTLGDFPLNDLVKSASHQNPLAVIRLLREENGPQLQLEVTSSLDRQKWENKRKKIRRK